MPFEIEGCINDYSWRWQAQPARGPNFKLKITGRFSFFNYLTDEKLKWLYRNCVALLYPSNYEGFGLPYWNV